MNLMRPIRKVTAVNIRGDPVELTIIGAIIRRVKPVRWANRIPSRRWQAQHITACATGPPIA